MSELIGLNVVQPGFHPAAGHRDLGHLSFTTERHPDMTTILAVLYGIILRPFETEPEADL